MNSSILSPIANKRYPLSTLCAERDFPVCNFYGPPLLGNFESLGKYNIDGLAKNFEAEKKNDFVSSLQLSYMSVKTIL